MENQSSQPQIQCVNIILTIFFCSLISCAVFAQNIIANPGFEGSYVGVRSSNTATLTGVTAPSWSENSNWATLAVDYARETNNPHSGEACQRIQLKNISYGAMQLIQRFPATRGRVYQFSVWARGVASGSYVELIFQRNSTPFNTYATRYYLVREGWQKITLTAILTEDTNVAAMIRSTVLTTLWVDDAELRDVTDQVGSGEPRSGNLLTNGSFEAAFAESTRAALGNGWHFSPRGQASMVQSAVDEFTDPRPALDRSGAADGQQALRVNLDARSAMQILSPAVACRAGQTYTASIALRALTSGVSVQLELTGAAISRFVSPTGTWQRFTVSGVVPNVIEGVRLRLVIRSNTPATLLIDAAQFNEGANSEYQAPHPHELAVLAPRPGAIFFEDETTALQLITTENLPAGATMRRTLFDLDNRATTLESVALPAAETAIPNLPRGLFKLRAQIVNAEGQPISAAVETVFARLPRPRNVPKEQAYFGVHCELSPEWLQIAQALGAKWVRLHDAAKITKWRLVEETKGTYRFYDEGVNLAHSMGIGILGMVDGAPPWASATPRATEGYFSMYNLPNGPTALADWRAYCKAIVSRYVGKIDHWEVWNEPWGSNFFQNGTPQLYGELLKAAHGAIREANPQAKVLGIDADESHDAFTTGQLAAANSDFYDIFAWHEYSPLIWGGANHVGKLRTEKFDRLQSAAGTPRKQWVTEGGQASYPASWYDSKSQAGSDAVTEIAGRPVRTSIANIVRKDALLLAAGVEKVFDYTLHHILLVPSESSAIYGTLEPDRALKGAGVARAILAYLIDGAKFTGRAELAAGIEAFTFEHADGQLVQLIWSVDGGEYEMALPRILRNTEWLDVQGNPLDVQGTLRIGIEPIYRVETPRRPIRRSAEGRQIQP
jgi:hypothetical protein